jgi:hypothetical protein
MINPRKYLLLVFLSVLVGALAVPICGHLVGLYAQERYATGTSRQSERAREKLPWKGRANRDSSPRKHIICSRKRNR